MFEPGFAQCEMQVRNGDRDRFIATLFAPAEHRAALFAVYAFNLEIARVREVARQPLAGEIRLQWWSDLLRGDAGGEAQSSPVAAALMSTIARAALPVAPFEELIAAHRFDLYNEPMTTMAELEAYSAAANLVPIAARILTAECSSELDALARHIGLAYAITGLLRALPFHAARGQLFLPLEVLARHGAGRDDVANRDATTALRATLAEMRGRAREHLAQARASFEAAPVAILPGLLPAALVRPTLARMERPGYDPFAPIEIGPWRRQWLIWRAARQPDRIFA